jgi:pimeloyl-ACP methyl ester carboxylesterase
MGQGRTLVFVHGVGMELGFWAPQFTAFAGAWDVVAYDMLGHGESVLPPPGVTLADYAAQLDGVMDGLDLEDAVIVGHSMGALVVLEYALTHPDRIAGVVAMNAVYRRNDAQKAAVARRAADLDHGRSDEGRRSTLLRWFGDPVPDALLATAAWVEAALTAVDPVGYARTYQLFATSDEAHVGRLPELAMPVCFMTGEDDANSSPAMSQAMAAEVRHGHACIVPGERHMMSLVSPAPVNAALAAFLATLR